MPDRLRILFATPAYWPAVAFGGPVWVGRELTAGLVRRGHELEVLTTSLTEIGKPPTARLRTTTRLVDGVSVRYLATPLRYRWMGITPSLPLRLARSPRPNVVHVFGYRDVVTTGVAAWCRARRIPYVFEPLDMFLPRFRNVPLKRAFDRALGEPVARGAARVIAVSEHERGQLLEAGLPPARVVVRPNGFPPPYDGGRTGVLRERLGLDDSTPLLLNVGRVSYKKGLDLLLRALPAIPDAQLAIVGPDDGDGTLARIAQLRSELGLEARVHLLGPILDRQPRELYADADVFVLPSRNESFGMVAAEAAAAGTASVVTDRCGVAELLGGRGALVVPCEVEEIGSAIRRLLGDEALRRRLASGGWEVAGEVSWDAVVERQEAIYRDALGHDG